MKQITILNLIIALIIIFLSGYILGLGQIKDLTKCEKYAIILKQ